MISLRTSIFTQACSPLFFFNDTATTEIYTLSLHDALPISGRDLGQAHPPRPRARSQGLPAAPAGRRSEEHTSELQSPCNLVCRLLLEKKIAHVPPDPRMSSRS